MLAVEKEHGPIPKPKEDIAMSAALWYIAFYAVLAALVVFVGFAVRNALCTFNLIHCRNRNLPAH